MEKLILKRVLGNKFKHKHYSTSKIDLLNQCNLIYLLLWIDETKLSYSHKQFKLINYPQFVVYENLLHNHYTGETCSPLTTLINFYNFTFPQALYLLNHFMLKVNKSELESQVSGRIVAKAKCLDIDFNYILEEDSLHSLDMEIKKCALSRSYAYLCNARRIDRDVVSNFIKQRFLAMDKKNNLCFLTYADPLTKNEVIAITKKGTTYELFRSNLVREHNMGFFYAPKPFLEENNLKSVYIFESCVDLMSFLTLIKLDEIEAPDRPSCFISLNGAGNREYLKKVLHTYPTIRKVFLCLDNDSFGIKSAYSIANSLKTSSCKVEDLQTILWEVSGQGTYCIDWNDLLRLKNK